MKKKSDISAKHVNKLQIKCERQKSRKSKTDKITPIIFDSCYCLKEIIVCERHKPFAVRQSSRSNWNCMYECKADEARSSHIFIMVQQFSLLAIVIWFKVMSCGHRRQVKIVFFSICFYILSMRGAFSLIMSTLLKSVFVKPDPELNLIVIGSTVFVW